MVLNCLQLVQILVKSDKVDRCNRLYWPFLGVKLVHSVQNLFLSMIDKMVDYL